MSTVSISGPFLVGCPSLHLDQLPAPCHSPCLLAWQGMDSALPPSNPDSRAGVSPAPWACAVWLRVGCWVTAMDPGSSSTFSKEFPFCFFKSFSLHPSKRVHCLLVWFHCVYIVFNFPSREKSKYLEKGERFAFVCLCCAVDNNQMQRLNYFRKPVKLHPAHTGTSGMPMNILHMLTRHNYFNSLKMPLLRISGGETFPKDIVSFCSWNCQHSHPDGTRHSNLEGVWRPAVP